MGRPKKEKYEIEERFLQEALLLAGSYKSNVQDKKYLEDMMAGNFEYTEDMAIDDLMGGGQQDGERVQTSNISNQPERIAILLMSGYVEKQKARMQKEAQEQMDEYLELCRQILIVDTAIAERMDARTQAVFRCLYIEKQPWSRVRDEYGNHLENKAISRCREKAINAIAKEISAAEASAKGGKNDGEKEKR